MTDLCAPFALETYQGQDWVARDGHLVHVAAPETIYLWARRPEALVELCLCDWGQVWALHGDGWAHDPVRLRELAAALAARAEALEGNGHA